MPRVTLLQRAEPTALPAQDEQERARKLQKKRDRLASVNRERERLIVEIELLKKELGVSDKPLELGE